MRLHANTLIASDIHNVVRNLDGVDVEVSSRGSRSHVRAFEVTLTGTSGRRKNTGRYGAGQGDDFAATWDEWGIVLADFYSIDPEMVAGSVGAPVYANGEHFRWTAAGRFDTLVLADQHKRHRWSYSGTSATGLYSLQSCTGCPAQTRRLSYGRTWDEVAGA